MKHTTRPTQRAGTLLVAALVLYFFANQTQVGWLYVMSASMAGCVLAAVWLNRAMLVALTAERSTTLKTSAPYPANTGPTGRLAESLHVGDELEVTLHLRSASGSAQLTMTETCPLTTHPDLKEQRLYIPRLPQWESLSYRYGVIIDQRGLQQFTPLRAESKAPFGIFARAGTLAAETKLLVYPEVRLLRRFTFIDRRRASHLSRPRLGVGSEVIGARPYRPGDSPRHIHWRSSARVGQLITKEFADDAQPSLLLALDCSQPTELTSTAFETAIKIAVSIGEYALRSDYRLALALNGGSAPKAVSRDVSWHGLLERLARVQPGESSSLGDALREHDGVQVAIVLPHPNPTLLSSLAMLRAAGAAILAVLVGDSGNSSFASQLKALGIDTRCVREHEDWAGELAEAPTAFPATKVPQTGAAP